VLLRHDKIMGGAVVLAWFGGLGGGIRYCF
jgi:hypothetical protein